MKMETETYEFTRDQIDYMIVCMMGHVATTPVVSDEDTLQITTIVDAIADTQERPELSLVAQSIRDRYLS